MSPDTIDQTLQINLTQHALPVPNTGFVGAVVDHLGATGCTLIIAAIVALLASLTIFLFRKKLSSKHKTPVIVSIIALFAATLGFAIPATTQLSSAIAEVQNTVTIDLAINAPADSATASQTTNLIIDQEYPDGYVVFAYTDEDNNLYNTTDKSAFFTNTTSSTTPDQLDMNSYGIKSKDNFYNKLSFLPEHPTKITDTESGITAGSIIPITYTAKADTTLPVGSYSTNGPAIHFDIQPNIYYLNYEGYSAEEHIVSQKHNPVFTLDETPTKTGYTFIEYNTKPDGTGDSYQPGDTFTVDYVNTTIYVLWEANHYTATFDATGGEFAPGVDQIPIDQVYDSNYILPEQNPTRIGYTFAGWWTDPTDGTEVTADTIVTTASDHTIYAHWIANTYNLIYNDNGGSGGPGIKTQSGNPTFTIVSNSPTRIGYTFLGWAEDQSATTPDYYAGDTITLAEPTAGTTSEHTLYAVWTENTYILSYDTNTTDPVTGMPTTQTQTANPYFTISTDQPNRIGYTFLGWAKTNAATTPEFQPGDSITLDEPSSTTTSTQTLYAVWQANTHNISYDLAGGTAGDKHPSTGTYDADIEISNPTRLGYTFKGWTITGMDNNIHYYGDTADYGNTSVNTSLENITATHFKNLQATKDSTVTFTAVWQANTYILRFNDNGGFGEPETQIQSANPTFTIGSVQPTRAYYTFAGWAKSATATSAEYQPGSSITLDEPTSGTTSEQVLYAVWTPNSYTLKYNANGGAGAPGDQSQSANPTFDISTTKPTRTGYTFTGWSKDSSATTPSYLSGGTITVGENDSETTLYAVWQANQYTVTFDHNDGTGVTETKTETYGSNYVLPNNPSRTGYTFAGWWTTPTGGTQITSGTTVKVTDNTQILYAHWTENTYNLIYSDNGGFGGPGTITQYHNPNFTISSSTPTRSGYIFKGWANSSSATTPDYYAGNSLTLPDPSSGTTSSKTIYAVWEEDPTMQGFACSSLTSGASKQLKDARDGKMYWVAKLADGKCWMTQNLDLDLSTSKTFTPDDTNITANWTPSFNTLTQASQYTDSNTTPRSLNLGEEYIYTSNSSSDDTIYTSLSTCASAHSEQDCLHYHAGNLYNWTAAKATNDSSGQTSYATSSNNSICPKGWTLPSANSAAPSAFGNMLYAQGIITQATMQGTEYKYTNDGFNKLRTTPLYWVRAGNIYNGSHFDAGSTGSYWSSTAGGSNNAHGADFDSFSNYPRINTNRGYGQSVRCIAQ